MNKLSTFFRFLLAFLISFSFLFSNGNVMISSLYAENETGGADQTTVTDDGSLTADETKTIDVSTIENFNNAINTINNGDGEYIINLTADIEVTDAVKLKKNTTTIIGNNHTISSSDDTSKQYLIWLQNGATLNLGKNDNTDTLNLNSKTNNGILYLDGTDSSYNKNPVSLNIYSGVTLSSIGKSYSSIAPAGAIHVYKYATINMYADSKIDSVTGNQAGAVNLGDESTFNFYGTISNCYGNTANYMSSAAGAIYVHNDSVLNMYDGALIDNCTNSTTFQHLSAGAVAISNGSVNQNTKMIMKGGTISNCSGYYSGAISIFNQRGNTDETTLQTVGFTMNGGTITNCSSTSTSTEAAGAIYLQNNSGVFNDTVYASASVSINGGTISNCSSESTADSLTQKNGKVAGGIHVMYGTLNMTDGTIESCETKNANYSGGGINGNNAVLNISGGTIKNNKSSHSGGGVNSYGGTLNISGGYISSNSATSMGGGVFSFYSTVDFTGGNITSNNATYGGGVYLLQDKSVTVKEATIEKNTAETGGGLYVSKTTNASISDSVTISNNKAKYYGGGIYTTSVTNSTIESATISYNTVTNGAGGGIYASKGKLIINKSSISNNNVSTYGGGLYLNAITSGSTIESSNINGNTTKQNGGGMYIYGTNNEILTIKSTNISSNQAGYRAGGISVNGSNSNTSNIDASDIYNYITNNTGTEYEADDILIADSNHTVKLPTSYENNNKTVNVKWYKDENNNRYPNTKENVEDVNPLASGAWSLKSVYTCTVSYEFKSENENQTLPNGVLSLLPGSEAVEYNTTVTPTQPSSTTVDVTNGRWTFVSYKPVNVENIVEDTTFVGTWKYQENGSITINVGLNKTYDGNAVILTKENCTTNSTGEITFTYEKKIDGNWTEVTEAKDAGEYRVKATVAETDTTLSATSDYKGFTISKANPTYETPTGLTATYGQTLNDVTLPEGFTWKDDVSTSVGDAGEQKFTVIYAPSDKDNYNTIEVEVTVTVNKASTATTISPESVTAQYGTDYSLTSETKSGETEIEGSTVTYYSDEECTKVIDKPTDVGTYYARGEYAGSDNYESSNSKVVTITISKANPTYETPTGLTATYGQTLNDVTLPDGFTWKDDVSTSVGDAGEQKFIAVYTPGDKDNYNTVEVEVTVTVNKASTETTISPESVTVQYGTDYNLTSETKSGETEIEGSAVTYYSDEECTKVIDKPTTVGTYYARGEYAGDSNYNGSNSKVVTITILPNDGNTTGEVEISDESEFDLDESSKTSLNSKAQEIAPSIRNGNLSLDGLTIDNTEELEEIVKQVEQSDSVDVKLQINAKESTASSQIQQAKKEHETVAASYDITIDLIVTVTDANNAIKATSTSNVKELAEPITIVLTIKTEVIENKAVRVLYSHDNKVEVINDITIEDKSDGTSTLTFKTSKFSNYVVLTIDGCDVVFETNGGTTIENQYVLFGNTIDFNNLATAKEGYTFAGWYLDESLTKKFDESTVLTKDTLELNLYAKWTKNQEEKPQPTSTPSTKKNVAETSDNSNLALSVGIGCMAIITAVGIVLFRSKHS